MIYFGWYMFYQIKREVWIKWPSIAKKPCGSWMQS